MLRCLAAVSLVLLLAGAAHAQSLEIETDSPIASGKPARNYLNLRIGGATTSEGGRPHLCLEGSPLDWLSLQMCGNGSGFLHNEPIPEMAHFRTNFRVYSFRYQDFWFHPRVGVGFAELQLADDEPGFRFTDTGRDGIETAGPEGVFSLQAVYAMGAGVEFVGEVEAGLAYLAHARQLATAMRPTQPFAGLTVGVGW